MCPRWVLGRGRSRWPQWSIARPGTAPSCGRRRSCRRREPHGGRGRCCPGWLVLRCGSRPRPRQCREKTLSTSTAALPQQRGWRHPGARLGDDRETGNVGVVGQPGVLHDRLVHLGLRLGTDLGVGRHRDRADRGFAFGLRERVGHGRCGRGRGTGPHSVARSPATLIRRSLRSVHRLSRQRPATEGRSEPAGWVERSETPRPLAPSGAEIAVPVGEFTRDEAGPTRDSASTAVGHYASSLSGSVDGRRARRYLRTCRQRADVRRKRG